MNPRRNRFPQERDKPRRRYHFHPPILLYVVATLLIAIAAINTQNNLLFWAFGLAVGGVLASGMISGASLMGLQVDRVMPGPLVSGTRTNIRYVLTNSNRFAPAFALRIEELPVRPFSQRALPWSLIISRPLAFATHVGPRRRTSVEAPIEAKQRGEVQLSAIRVSTSFPFGLIRKSITFDRPASILVRPQPLTPSKRDDARTLRWADSGPATSRKSGISSEFFGLRDYRPGDSARNIAWKPSARLDRLLVTVNTSPVPLRLMVGLHLGNNTSETPDDESATKEIERAISLAAGLIERAARDGVPVGLHVFGSAVRYHCSLGSRHIGQLLDALARLNHRQVHQPRPLRVGTRQRCIVIHAGRVDASLAAATHWAAAEDAVSPTPDSVPEGGRKADRKRLKVGSAG